MSFHMVPVKTCSGLEALDLIPEFDKLEGIYQDDKEHGCTMVCQVFKHAKNDTHYFISGKVLDKEQSTALRKILEAKR